MEYVGPKVVRHRAKQHQVGRLSQGICEYFFILPLLLGLFTFL